MNQRPSRYRSGVGVHDDSGNSKYYSMQRPEIAKLLPRPVNRILDVGCGEGVFAKFLKDQGLAQEVWGVELNEGLRLVAAQRLDKVLIGDISTIISDFPAEFFDVVFFNDCLEHMVDPFSVLNDIRGKISRNGYVIGSLPNIGYIRQVYELIIQKDWRYCDQGIMDRTHLRFFTLKSMKRMFSETNFTAETVVGIAPIRRVLFVLFKYLSFGWLTDSLYRQYIWRLRL